MARKPLYPGVVIALVCGLWACARDSLGQQPTTVPGTEQSSPEGFVEPPATPEQLRQRVLEGHSRIAWQTLQRGAFELAEVMFRDILRRDPDRPDDIAGLSAALARQTNLDAAIELLNDAVRRFPDSARLASALGQAHLAAQNHAAALEWLGRAYELRPDLPDLRYFLGSAYLNCEYPMRALELMCGADSSGKEMAWVQDLAIGTAFGQLGLQDEASSYFTRVATQAAGTSIEQSARQLQQQMDEAVFGREYWRGSLRVTSRYDTNPGVIPALNATGGALSGTRSWGNLYQGNLSYDLARGYNYDLTAGYNFLHTSNYDAHEFDLLDNGLFLASNRREYWNGMPAHLGFRVDYDHLYVGNDDFLQRFVATPSIGLIQSDCHSTVVLFRYTLFDFLSQGAFDKTAFDLDSDNLMVGVARERQLLCRTLKLLVGYQYDHNFSDGRNYDYGGHKVQVGVDWKTPLDGLRVHMLGELHWRGYDHPHSVFGDHRDDEEYMVQVGLNYPLHCGWVAAIEWSYNRNDSNVPTNDYRRHTLDFGLEYRFPGRSEDDR